MSGAGWHAPEQLEEEPRQAGREAVPEICSAASADVGTTLPISKRASRNTSSASVHWSNGIGVQREGKAPARRSRSVARQRRGRERECLSLSKETATQRSNNVYRMPRRLQALWPRATAGWRRVRVSGERERLHDRALGSHACAPLLSLKALQRRIRCSKARSFDHPAIKMINRVGGSYARRHMWCPVISALIGGYWLG